ncbi:class I SAM-dependent methyltransferase [Paenibacillus sp. HN-1]|uniref:class I SAM-dependent methyltransferase n=1 Tax=Paenibacillus TaxID=44249 RepID=UPI001CAA2D92|nr:MULTISPECIES: class I SAM-dependent methyltransferase [Paenibacillus]MBY9081565.1 class I SAM-dependent methyltransferase [Paenibacillus sp. CGMCC 1.18879]MBY9087688.1 class I SAM-dependent methyltransferase [Paenibacillus sinensis]
MAEPQTVGWCNRLAACTGKYELPPGRIIEGEEAEETLTKKLRIHARGKVLDVGCGHGAYTEQWAKVAEEVVGYDMTEGFIETAKAGQKPNISYVLGRTNEGLPFDDNSFDIAYTKKGPTSWYAEGNRIVRPGGRLLLFHPGDGDGDGGELGICFPGLFAPPSPGTPILDKIEQRLGASGLTGISLSKIKETVWLPAPEDVLSLLTFGQSDSFTRYASEQCLPGIRNQFEKHAGGKGLLTTSFYYFIEATAT